MSICCFFGHKKIYETEKLKKQLNETIEKLINDEKVDTFLFGSKSRFNSLCYKQVTEIKEKYPDIKRIYVRAEFPQINESYESYLLENYENTYFPQSAIGAGRAVYIKRNYDMIDKSEFCIFYYQENYLPHNRKSGTKTALDYAINRKKKIIILP